MTSRTLRPLLGAIAIGASLALASYDNARAEFVLNWEPVPGGSPLYNGTETTFVQFDKDGFQITLSDQTPFLYESFVDGSIPYYHMIIGDPATGFAQEVYIQAGNAGGSFSCSQNNDICGDGGTGSANPISQDSLSSSGGAGANVALGSEGNAFNPMSADAAFSGNSSGNPLQVQMRQLLKDGDLTVDFVKDKFAEKPSITNTIDAGDFKATFVMNSSGNLLSSGTTASAVTNTVELLGSNPPPDVRPPGGGPSSARFDMETDAQFSSVTAGQYSYTPGSGRGGSEGTYTYKEGSANINPDWASYFDDREANPWAYPDNRP